MSTHDEDRELASLLETLSPEELTDLSEEEMDKLLEAKMRVSVLDNPQDEALSSFADDEGGARFGNPGPSDSFYPSDTAPDDQQVRPYDGTPTNYVNSGGYNDGYNDGYNNDGYNDGYTDDGYNDDGFDIMPGEDTGISNTAVSDAVGSPENVDYDSFDDTDADDDNYTDDDYLGNYTPQRPQHPDDTHNEEELANELSTTPTDERDPYSDKVELTDDTDKPGIIDKIKNLPTPVKIAVPAAVVVIAVVASLLSGGETITADPVGNGSAKPDNNAAVAPNTDGAAIPNEEDNNNKPVLLTNYIQTTSAKCVDNPKSKNLGPSHAFSTVETDAWVCYRAMGVDGAVMNIVFRQPVTLTEIRLTPGYNFLQQQSGEDKWVQHRVISRILWRAGGQQFVQEIEPQRSEVAYVFDKPVTTDSMSLTIQKSVVPDGANESTNADTDLFQQEGDATAQVGELQDATAVQNLQIYGYPKDPSTGGQSQTIDGADSSQADVDSAGAK